MNTYAIDIHWRGLDLICHITVEDDGESFNLTSTSTEDIDAELLEALVNEFHYEIVDLISNHLAALV